MNVMKEKKIDLTSFSYLNDNVYYYYYRKERFLFLTKYDYKHINLKEIIQRWNKEQTNKVITRSKSTLKYCRKINFWKTYS